MATAKARAGLSALIGTHACLTLTSLGYGMYGGSYLQDEDPQEVFDAKHYDIMTELVTSMYAGRGLHHTHVQLSDSITFEDAAAICSGPQEVRGAFRAMAKLEPQSRGSPRCVDVKPLGEWIVLTYALNQRYLGWFDLRSLLVVHVQLKQMQDSPESKFLVTKIEEQWNGVPPINTYLFRIPRRLNGILSWRLTTWLIPEGRR